MTEEERSTKWEEIVAEHDIPGAREQLASGWKEYLGMHYYASCPWCWHCEAGQPLHCGLGHAVGGCKPAGPMTRAQRA